MFLVLGINRGMLKTKILCNTCLVLRKDLTVRAYTPRRNIGVEVYLYLFLTPALDVGEWSASRSGCFVPDVTTICTHWTREWVKRTAELDVSGKRKNPLPKPGFEPAMVQRIVYHIHEYKQFFCQFSFPIADLTENSQRYFETYFVFTNMYGGTVVKAMCKQCGRVLVSLESLSLILLIQTLKNILIWQSEDFPSFVP